MTQMKMSKGNITVVAVLAATISFTVSTLLPWITGNTTNVARLEERIIYIQMDVTEIKDLMHEIHPPKE